MEQEIKIQEKESFFDGKEGAKIYERFWLPEGDYKAILVIVHGYAEHSGRYDHVARFFCQHGLACAALDHRSHGKSSGKDTEIKDFRYFLDDLEMFITRVKEQLGDKPLFILGHSMGGAILSYFAIDRKPLVKGLIFSGAAVKLSDDFSPLLLSIVSILGKIAPRMKTQKLDGNAVSRDPQVVERYNADPLNYRGGIPARTGAELNLAIKFIQAHMQEIDQPALILFGSEDRLADPAGSKKLYEMASSKDKTMKVYEGLYHEILNEPEKEQVMADILAWIEKHLD